MSEQLKPETIARYHVFLASPGDMDTERKAVRQFFQEYNATTAARHRFEFAVIDWENYATAGVGRPQELITQQTLEKYRSSLALVIGLMGQRFGSPSGTHESGTEEEFAWALQAHTETGFPEIKWFFRKISEFKAPSDPEQLQEAVAQWGKVRSFRERIEKNKQLFFRDFTDLEDFRTVLRKDLTLWLNASERRWAAQGKTVPTPMPALPQPSAPPDTAAPAREGILKRYLEHVISRNRYLQLQGIRSGGRLVHIELEQIYITLKATRTQSIEAEEAWLAEERQLAPGELQKRQHESRTETVSVKVEDALAEHRHLVVLGDPGSGKTTLMRYLALCYARACDVKGSTLLQKRLGLQEEGRLPILLPLRNLGAYLKANKDVDGTEGHSRLLAFLRAYLEGERISVPDDFFDTDLAAGRVVMLFDGMDEVGDFELRCRVARLIEKFAGAYPTCRIVVTSRVVGYSGAARLGEGFSTTTVRDFTLTDVEQFLSHWHRQIAVGQMGASESAEDFAADQTQQLMEAIRENPRVRELAINPLMLTVIALVHRDRVKLPERRAELYAEAIDVLLGKWDEARGVEESRIFDDRPFDTGDRRLLLQSIAFHMHEAALKEIEADSLREQLKASFASMVSDQRTAEKAVDTFLEVVQERTGLLVEAGVGVYRFSHLTFQEYLTAVEVAERDDYLPYTLSYTGDAFWREAILLEAGYLSMKNRAKTTRLIKAIADEQNEPEPFHNLVLAAECIRDVGPTRVEGDLTALLSERLQSELNQPIPTVESSWLTRLLRREAKLEEQRRAVLLRRVAATTALSRIESENFGTGSQYWSLPHGEPEWVTIPAGEFWMGNESAESYEGERPICRLFIPEFKIARTPVTNAQYKLFLEANADEAQPHYWVDGEPPKDQLAHPVVGVSWEDACRYCQWLSEATGSQVRLPTEAEWEKAARGARGKREYPWGDEFDLLKCNTWELKLLGTTPVGIFLAGASPYGCLDMSGNVLEWVNDWFDKNYYKQGSDRNLNGPENGEDKVVRGGSWLNNARHARVSSRYSSAPGPRLTAP